LSLKATVYCLSGDLGVMSVCPSDSCDREPDMILYSASSHAPKSIYLHRREQKGRNFASSDFSVDDTLTILLQIGHLFFIPTFILLALPQALVPAYERIQRSIWPRAVLQAELWVLVCRFLHRYRKFFSLYVLRHCQFP
jgi:hypothetical protein